MDPTRPTLTRQMLAMGYSHNELARLRRAGTVVQLRRGAYSWVVGEVEAAVLHRQAVLATVAMVAADAVISHTSAAVLHKLPVWDSTLARVHVTRQLTSGGRRRGPVHLGAAPLPDAEVVLLDGVRVTSLARTVVDLARQLPFDQTVAAGDAALRAGLADAELSAALDSSRRRPGVTAARRTVDFLDGRSESPGESLSRVAFLQWGIPAPQLQFRVTDAWGRFVGRSDFCWEEQRTLGEFDGKIKYGRLLKPGETAQEVVYREKRREDAMRDLDWKMVRWGAADLKPGSDLPYRLQRAFDRR